MVTAICWTIAAVCVAAILAIYGIAAVGAKGDLLDALKDPAARYAVTVLLVVMLIAAGGALWNH